MSCGKLKAVDQEFPSREILDLVENDMAGVAIDLIDSGDEFIGIGEIRQTFVVEIGITPSAQLMKQMKGERRFPRASGAHDHADQIGFDDRLRRQLAFDIGSPKLLLKFRLLSDHDVAKVHHGHRDRQNIRKLSITIGLLTEKLGEAVKIDVVHGKVYDRAMPRSYTEGLCRQAHRVRFPCWLGGPSSGVALPAEGVA
jgi:hypothetical protein